MDIEDNVYILPSELVCQTIGFNIDSGGSATKVIYRSKRDYHHSKPINPKIPEGKGWMRMINFLEYQAEELVNFLEKECDIDQTITDKTVTVAGIHADWFAEKIKERFGISFRRGSEIDFQPIGLRCLFENNPLHEIMYPEDEGAIQKGMYCRAIYSLVRERTEERTTARGQMFGLIDKDKKSETAAVAEEETSFTPFMLSQCGSASAATKIEKDWSYNFVDMSTYGGRAFLSVCTMICGESKSYDEVMKLAATGDVRKVDLYPDDMVQPGCADFYGGLPASVLFNFAKPAFENRDAFKQEDLLASWVEATCADYTAYIHLAAFAHGVERVVMMGGFFNHPLTRSLFTKYWVSRFYHVQEKKIDLYFLKNSQHLAALGAFIHDVERTKSQ